MKSLRNLGGGICRWPLGALLIALALLWTVAADGAMLPRNTSASRPPYPGPATMGKMTQEYGPESARVTWIGVGGLRKFTITNAGLLGLYEQPNDWTGYDGTWPSNTTNWNGYCAEYPAGSNQFYNFSSGAWIGAMYPYVLGTDTTWVPRVATGAYTPDMCPMSKLYSSDQMLPPESDFAGAAMFAPSGTDPLPHQQRWTYADSGAINPRRREAFGSNEYALDPGNGDIVSLQDTWCAYGDSIEEGLGSFLWPAFGYDTEGLGLLVEQRTYSWSYGTSSNYLFITFKITNTNDFPLDSLYLGFFMDNDVGPGALEEEGVGPNDDLIGYDEALKLGYTYDNDLREPGWATAAGYIGCVFVETPTNPGEDEEIGMNAFSTWVRSDQGPEGIVDDEQQDPLKYGELVGDSDGQGHAIPDDPDPAVFEVFETPRDVRMLPCSGPYRHLGAGETISWTVAVVMGGSLAELKDNTRQAQTHFDNGYIGTAPPPPPNLILTAGDRKAFLTWDDSPEDEADVITRVKDFEGYRVYRSTTGLPGSWEQLAEYDIAGDSTGRAVQVRYRRGNAVLGMGFDGFYKRGDASYLAGEYFVEFTSDSTFTVYNNTQQTLYRYDVNTLDSTAQSTPSIQYYSSFCVVDPSDTETVYAPPLPGNEYVGRYVPGALIYMNGFFFHIEEGEPSEVDPPGTLYNPQPGDLFIVQSFLSEPLGEQNGLFYSYADEGLTNGVTYYYSVTSFDKGLREEGLESLESSTTGTKYSVVPRTDAADYYGTDTWSTLNGRLSHVEGTATGSLFVDVAQPAYLSGHDYSITFLRQTEARPKAGWWRLTDLSADTVLLDSMWITPSDTLVEPTAEVIDGLRFRVQCDKKANVDTVGLYAGIWTQGACGYNFGVYGGLTGPDPDDPYDFEITFPDTGSTDFLGNHVPWVVTNVSLDRGYLTAWADLNKDDVWNDGDQIKILNPDTRRQIITLVTWVNDSTRPPGTSSTYFIKTNKPFTDGDEYRFSSNRVRSEYNLDNIKVVPNPYYIRAPWDNNRFNQWIYFQHLPSHCTIRIFTAAGLLIRTMRHDSEEGDGSATWDLLTDETMRAVSGLYIYQVESDDGKTAVGKFAIVR
jgi:hypothetical protein